MPSKIYSAYIYAGQKGSQIEAYLTLQLCSIVERDIMVASGT